MSIKMALGLVLALALAEQGVEYLGYKRAKLEDSVAAKNQELRADAELEKATARIRNAELALQEIKNQQEIKDVANQTTVAGLAAKLRSAGRVLRDPNAAACDHATTDQTPGAAIAGADHESETGGVFSEPATRLLELITREADEINSAYASCRNDAYAVRSLVQ